MKGSKKDGLVIFLQTINKMYYSNFILFVKNGNQGRY